MEQLVKFCGFRRL